MKKEYDGELLLVGPNSIKQKNEFKRMFAKSVNLSKVDSSKWQLSLKKIKMNDYELKFIYEKKIFNTWLVHRTDHIRVEYDDLVAYNKRAEKMMFKEEYMYGPKDEEGLDCLVKQVEQGGFGVDYYPTILNRATYYWYAIATKQMFYNGNKRTALTTAITYLENNGYEFEIKDKQSLYNVSLELAQKKMSKKKLFEYIQAHSSLNFNWMSKILKRQ